MPIPAGRVGRCCQKRPEGHGEVQESSRGSRKVARQHCPARPRQGSGRTRGPWPWGSVPGRECATRLCAEQQAGPGSGAPAAVTRRASLYCRFPETGWRPQIGLETGDRAPLEIRLSWAGHLPMEGKRSVSLHRLPCGSVSLTSACCLQVLEQSQATFSPHSQVTSCRPMSQVTITFWVYFLKSCDCQG